MKKLFALIVTMVMIVSVCETANCYPWTPISITPIYKPQGNMMVKWGEKHELSQTEFNLYKAGGNGSGITQTFWESGSGSTYDCGCSGAPYDCLETIVIYPTN